MHASAITASASRPSTGDEPRWCALWRTLGTARRELEDRRTRNAAIEQAFARDIEPREIRLTTSVLSLIDLLIERYRQGVLDEASRALLALWIGDDLERLQDHPFARRDAVARTRRRWRALLAPGSSSTPERSAARRGTGLPTFDDGPARSDHEPTHPADTADRAPDDAEAQADDAVRIDIDAMLPAADDDSDAAARHLVERLFRRLAQSIHPDREADAERRQVKQSLMRKALGARGARDLDTLLSLHVEHVDSQLAGLDTQVLEKALLRQLEGTRRALHRLRHADPLRRRIIERYDARDEAVRDRLVRTHAARLDEEHDRLSRLQGALSNDDDDHAALQAALDQRRSLELDRLAIDELTGLR